MGQQYARFGEDFEFFVRDELGMEDIDLSKNAEGEYINTLTARLHTMWDHSWTAGYDYGYDNGTRDERIELRNSPQFGRYMAGCR